MCSRPSFLIGFDTSATNDDRNPTPIRFRKSHSEKKLPGSGRVVEFLLGVPGMWPLIRPLCGWFDHRPGRLYSFVAAKP